MRVLVGCEYSGKVRDAFAAAGHDAMSCDLLPSETPGKHYQGDVFDVMEDGWDLAIFHPPCTYLCSSGMHWNNRGRGHEKTDEAIAFFLALLCVDIPRVCIENPVGVASRRVRPADQLIQPYQFGHCESKGTQLWLKGLPLLRATNLIEKPASGRWENTTASGQNRLSPGPDRWKIRSATYGGIAQAMADQWSNSPCVMPEFKLQTKIW